MAEDIFLKREKAKKKNIAMQPKDCYVKIMKWKLGVDFLEKLLQIVVKLWMSIKKAPKVRYFSDDEHLHQRILRLCVCS